MNDDTSKDDAPALPAQASEGPFEPGANRLQWIFRDALRQRRVHPLMDLLRQYREKSAP